MHFVADFIVYIVIDLIWTGICYLTGSVLIKVFFGGRYIAGSWREVSDVSSSSSHTETAIRAQTPLRRINAVSVSFIGMFFWFAFAFLIWAAFHVVRT